MITSYDELVAKIDNLNLGVPVVRIAVSDTFLALEAPVNPDKANLSNSEYWLDRAISANLKRRYDPTLNKWQVKSDVLHRIKQNILSEIFYMISSCSGAKMPERTSLYKDYKNLNNKQDQNPEYYTHIINIVNYYYQSRTDSICKSNVIGLLELLRKKYNGKSG
jgi:hypothetical protein